MTLARAALHWTALGQVTRHSAEELPPFGDLMLVVGGAVLCAVVFLVAIFSLMAMEAGLQRAPQGALIVGALNLLAVVFWVFVAGRQESVLAVFGAVQLLLAVATLVVAMRHLGSR